MADSPLPDFVGTLLSGDYFTCWFQFDSDLS